MHFFNEKGHFFLDLGNKIIQLKCSKMEKKNVYWHHNNSFRIQFEYRQIIVISNARATPMLYK